MLKECNAHGYFRAEYCPACGSQAKFLLSDEEVNMLGRTLAGVLRHFPERYGLEMDNHGWVDLRAFIDAVQVRNRRFRFLRPHHVTGLIETDPKGRYEAREGKVRATYAHSVDVELDLPTEDIPETLYYPTAEEGWKAIQEAGIKPTDRKRVHLSGTFAAAMEAGKVRIPSPAILEINAKGAREKGRTIFKAGKTVYLTDEMPPEFIRRMEEEEYPAEAPPLENEPE